MELKPFLVVFIHLLFIAVCNSIFFLIFFFYFEENIFPTIKDNDFNQYLKCHSMGMEMLNASQEEKHHQHKPAERSDCYMAFAYEVLCPASWYQVVLSPSAAGLTGTTLLPFSVLPEGNSFISYVGYVLLQLQRAVSSKEVWANWSLFWDQVLLRSPNM